MEEFFKRVWLDWAIMMKDTCHREIMDELIYRFAFEDRLPDEDSLHFMFSIYGS